MHQRLLLADAGGCPCALPSGRKLSLLPLDDAQALGYRAVCDTYSQGERGKRVSRCWVDEDSGDGV